MPGKKIRKKDDVNVLKNRIKYLEEEVVRKQEEIEKLRKENLVLFRTALKRSEKKVDERRSEASSSKESTNETFVDPENPDSLKTEFPLEKEEE